MFIESILNFFDPEGQHSTLDVQVTPHVYTIQRPDGTLKIGRGYSPGEAKSNATRKSFYVSRQIDEELEKFIRKP